MNKEQLNKCILKQIASSKHYSDFIRKQIKVYHGTASIKFAGNFRSHHNYFTNSYNLAKAFGLGGTIRALELGDVIKEKEPYVLEVTLKTNKKKSFLITNTEMLFLFPDAIYENDVEGYELHKDDLFVLDKYELEHLTELNIKTIKQINFKRRKITGFDKYGVGKFYLLSCCKIKTVDVKHKIWDVDTQMIINKAGEDGYDILQIKNIIEGGTLTPDIKSSVTYVVYNKNVIKSKEEMITLWSKHRNINV